MQTNLLFYLGLLTASFSASVSAQFSANCIGYVNTAVPVGYSMIANPVNTTNNTIGSLLTDVPNFCNVLKWTGTEFTVATYVFGAWDNPGVTLHPGEGAFINTDTAFTITWVGEVLQGAMTNDFPAGYSIRSGKIPVMGPGPDIIILGNVLQAFDNLLKWNGASYDIYTVLPGGSWDPAQPQIRIGESFFLNVQQPTPWRFTFSVN